MMTLKVKRIAAASAPAIAIVLFLMLSMPSDNNLCVATPQIARDSTIVLVPRDLLLLEKAAMSEAYGSREASRVATRGLLATLVVGLSSFVLVGRVHPALKFRYIVVLGYAMIGWIYVNDRMDIYYSCRINTRESELVEALTQFGDTLRTFQPNQFLGTDDFCGKVCSLLSPGIDHLFWYGPLTIYMCFVLCVYAIKLEKP